MKIMEMCPTDFVDEINEYDCDGIADQDNGDAKPYQKTAQEIRIIDKEDCVEDQDNGDAKPYQKTAQGIRIVDKEDNFEDNPNEVSFVNEIITVADVRNTEIQIEIQHNEKLNDQTKVKMNKKHAEKPKKNESSHKGIILAQNVDIKKRSIKFLEEEHTIKMGYHKREQEHQDLRHKLEIELMSLKKNNLLLEKEKKELEIQLLKQQLDLIQ